ncbi:MAG: flagellar basal body-associated FliL family protein [Zetaproteobacteria bacterium]|nr:flagellar basal body-associated FliL family protein [Zetaproteobacteria bacterium]
MADAKQTEAKKSSGNLMQIIIVALLVLILAVGGFIAWKILQTPEIMPTDTAPAQTAETKIPEAEVEDPSVPPILVDVDNITINLADENESRFLRAKIKLEVRTEEDKIRLTSDLGKAKVNDLILTLLSNKTFKEIRTAQGKYALKEEIVFRINKAFSGKPVRRMYFTDFVSQ